MIGIFFLVYAEIYEPVGTIAAVLIVAFVSAKTSVASDNKVISSCNSTWVFAALFLHSSASPFKAELSTRIVGLNTMMGKMAEEMLEDEPDSPLKVKLAKLANQISTFGYIGAIVIAVLSAALLLSRNPLTPLKK